VYVFEPDGAVFTAPVSVTVEKDVSHLPPNQRDRLDLYRYDDDAEAFRALNAQCTITEDPPLTFTATCTADDIDHFSRFALIAVVDWPIPVVSQRGLVTMTVVLLVAGIVILRRRRALMTR
jgi:hypothetical protein